MRSIKYIVVSLLLAFATKVQACWSPVYTPGEYYVFYAYDKNDQPETWNTAEQNITEWQQYISNRATYDDIQNVVYGYSLEDMERVGSKSFTIQDTLYRNTFVKFLIDTKEHEAIQYLVLAKKCEIRRALRDDKWWYPTKEDLRFDDLREILSEALAYKGSRLNVRYWLQAVRAAYTMGEDELCLQLWNDHISKSPPSVIRTMCEDYIGGIYFQRGEYETAIARYANTMQSSSSFWWCVDNLTEANSDIERIQILYKYHPSSPELAVMVQKICREAEDKANSRVFDGQDSSENCYENCGYSYYLKNRDRYMALRDFALQAASEERSDNPAMWQYAASFLTLIDGDAPLAMKYLTKAEVMKGTPFVKNNIKVLRIMVDAMTGSYNTAFDAKMLPGLQWLDDMIQNNLTDVIREEYMNYEGAVFDNYSLYYFNDMMRKITLSVMAPRYLQQGDQVKALLLAGMASERLRTVTNYRRNPGGYNPTWNIDFYTDVFSMMDTLSVNSIIGYRDLLQKGRGGVFERFLAARCYNNADYFNEIIGTQYMRTEQFDKAVEYFSKVRPSYDSTLNIYEYFWHDPLSEPYFGHKFISPATGYKLDFAKRMLVLQKKMNTAKNKEVKAEAMYQYAVGLMRATNDCWALVRYKNGWMFKPDDFDQWGNRIINHYNQLFDGVVALSTNRELKAKCFAAQVWVAGDDRLVYESDADWNWKKVANLASVFEKMYHLLASDEYASTCISQRLFSECDSFLSYQSDTNNN